MTASAKPPDMTVTTVRLDVTDSWLRCRKPGCGKLMALLVGGLDDRPSDVHWCLACDPPPSAVWNRTPSPQEAL